MAYKLLGMLVWKGGKILLRRRYGAAYVPKPVLAGAAMAAVAGVGLVVAATAKRASS